MQCSTSVHTHSHPGLLWICENKVISEIKSILKHLMKKIPEPTLIFFFFFLGGGGGFKVHLMQGVTRLHELVTRRYDQQGGGMELNEKDPQKD